MIVGSCNLCGFPVIKINKDNFGTRCINCKSTKIHRAVGFVIKSLNFSDRIFVYELSSRGALYKYLKSQFKNFYYSEYFDDVPPGLIKNSIVCQDVQHLLLNDESFDLVTSTEVFEHVPNDKKGFREVCRILKTNGYFIFTVPLSDNLTTVERCYQKPDGTIEHILDPEYHGDRIRGRGQVLAFRNYGSDIVERLKDCGFSAEIRNINCDRNSINNQKVIVAKKISI
ncbi:SAM-dependent methyltransferase [Hydrococcus rivularis NIES-593]|uniref:SAM-dependent methyltransferase n=1 Tax=Hydrococcus rivularis NIES-593 TaxID=1921803 RepID=A0A1U7HJQ4_9CYAN|nr:class I SAM-dependent methyltransferase [Hydrococcus rivularis]OKH23784.1 SAM-dependent methyltransferase [Hydrococcus rivularis NIES-593]